MKFLYLDEQYIEPDSYRDGSVKRRRRTILTGLLVSSGQHDEFRKAYYSSIAKVLGSDPEALVQMPEIHASNLFPGAEDEERFSFLRSIVAMIRNFDIKIYRVGYFRTKHTDRIFAADNKLIGLCFLGILFCLQNEGDEEIWPVVETDRSVKYDRIFSQSIHNHHFHSVIRPELRWSVDFSKIGECLYCTKNSSYGAVTDIIGYILDAQDAVAENVNSIYKKKLAEFSDDLLPQIAYNEVKELIIEG